MSTAISCMNAIIVATAQVLRSVPGDGRIENAQTADLKRIADGASIAQESITRLLDAVMAELRKRGALS